MSEHMRPWRSVLYIPGSKARALEKARELAVDAIIFDLEDAVAPGEKAAARETLAGALRQGGYGDRASLVRINALDTEWGEDDLEAVSATQPHAIVLPKVDAARDVGKLAERLALMPGTQNTRIWAMMETARGVLDAAAIARSPRMEGFVMGTNDLAAELGCEPGADRMPLTAALQGCVMAARAAGIAVVDGVYNKFKDEEGLRAECAQGRRLGMDGKSLIHPSQVEPANAAFTPSQEEVELARRQIAAWEEASAAGQGVAVLDGQIVENLHVAKARKTLAQAGA